MRDKISEALDMLREEGIRIPRAFSKRLEKKKGYSLGRADVKKIKEAVGELGMGQRLVIGFTVGGELFTYDFETYQTKVKFASRAREVRAEKANVEAVR